MNIGSIKEGDLVEVSWKQGDHMVALVAAAAHDDATGRRVIGLSKDPPRGLAKPMRLTATAREVTHWGKRGRKHGANHGTPKL